MRINSFRDMIMIDILLRVMRKIVNEEIKLKSKVINTSISPDGQTHIEEFY